MGDDDESGDEWDDFGSDRESVGDEEDGILPTPLAEVEPDPARFARRVQRRLLLPNPLGRDEWGTTTKAGTSGTTLVRTANRWVTKRMGWKKTKSFPSACRDVNPSARSCRLGSTERLQHAREDPHKYSRRRMRRTTKWGTTTKAGTSGTTLVRTANRWVTNSSCGGRTGPRALCTPRPTPTAPSESPWP
jgi:hypothetical protein